MRSTVLCFSGLDPSGGAGIQADIESILATGSHAAIACTALTIQNSQRVFAFEPTSSQLLLAQAQAVMADLPVGAFKSGMLGSISNIEALLTLLEHNPHIPYVLDPVLVANSGDALGDVALLREALLTLIPLATLVTPNIYELKTLANTQHIDKAIETLTSYGANAILLKGAHANLPSRIEHALFEKGVCTMRMISPRLDAEFHGSGCSLASFIAGKLAQKVPLKEAVQHAEIWLQHTLHRADQPHIGGQRIPMRTNYHFK